MNNTVTIELTAEELKMIRLALQDRVDYLEGRNRADDAKKYDDLYLGKIWNASVELLGKDNK